METKHSIVKQAIKSKILDGTFQPNQKISSETELMKQFNVSRHTVRLAVGELVNQGWLYREQGAGTFCVDRSQKNKLDEGIASKNIAIITTYISDYIFPSIIRGAESYLSKHGFHVSLFSTNNNYDYEKQFLEKILTQQFAGVIIEPTKSALSNPNINYYLNLERQNIPYIMINANYDVLEPLSITLNDEKGGYLQADHLIKLGHQNIIGFFKTDDIQGSKRMKGFIKAHRDNGLLINPNNIVTYSTSEKGTKPLSMLRNVLKNTAEAPSAIVCYNDELAIILLDVLREHKLRVPDDISVVGFDNSFLAQVSEVKLTSVEHPLSEMGKNAAKIILDLIKYKQTNTKKPSETIESIVYEPKLVVRNSTKEFKL